MWAGDFGASAAAALIFAVAKISFFGTGFNIHYANIRARAQHAGSRRSAGVELIYILRGVSLNNHPILISLILISFLLHSDLGKSPLQRGTWC